MITRIIQSHGGARERQLPDTRSLSQRWYFRSRAWSLKDPNGDPEPPPLPPMCSGQPTQQPRGQEHSAEDATQGWDCTSQFNGPQQAQSESPPHTYFLMLPAKWKSLHPLQEKRTEHHGGSPDASLPSSTPSLSHQGPGDPQIHVGHRPGRDENTGSARYMYKPQVPGRVLRPVQLVLLTNRAGRPRRHVTIPLPASRSVKADLSVAGSEGAKLKEQREPVRCPSMAVSCQRSRAGPHQSH